MRGVILVAFLIAFALVSCLSDGKVSEPGMTASRSTVEIKAKYPDVDPIYYDRIAQIEAIAEEGKRLYDAYYRKKKEEKVKDRELALRGRQVLQKALDKVYHELYKETGAQSLLHLYTEISPYATELAKELEPGIEEE